MAADGQGRCPAVFHAPQDGTGVGNSAATGIVALALHQSMSVRLLADGAGTGLNGASLPDSKTLSAFVSSVSAESFELADADSPTPVVAGAKFENVVPGSSLAYALHGKNDIFAAGSGPELFGGTLTTQADGCVTVGSRKLLVLVPPVDLAP